MIALRLKVFLLFLASFALAVSLNKSTWLCPETSGQTPTNYGVQAAFPNLTFNQPIGLYNAADGSNRIFIVEQPGTLRVFQNSPTTTTSTAFLDISNQVLFSGEQGLLGLAFHPNFPNNGYVYLDYVAPNPTRTVIARYTVTAQNPNVADKTSELIVLEISQPFPNHKGGQIAFGPDGYLYIGMGDGGSEGDPLGNGQNCSTLLGKILRIDVNLPSGGRNYGIPSDNPFIDNAMGYAKEIYAYGFRNPWRFSFDSTTGKLYVGDVGQDRMEEIDIVQNGLNYGWNIMEGTLPYAGGSEIGLQLPIYEYDHTLGDAIIGGFIYHGLSLTELPDEYVYGDYGSGRIWALAPNGTNTQLVDSNLTISSFGVDENKELYICAFDGKIYQLNTTGIPEFPAAAAVTIMAIVITVVTITLITVFRRKLNHAQTQN